jgi:hypothetical protein
MRVFLQDSQTGLYFRNLDTWTESLRHARDFEFYERAMGFACEEQIWDARIVRILQRSGHVETFPLPIQRFRPPPESAFAKPPAQGTGPTALRISGRSL